MSKDLIVPTVHLNGTKGEDLLDQLSEARHALSLAMKALQNAAPNGRDFYPQGDWAIIAALKQHEARYKALESVYKELGQIAEGIADQGV